MTVPLTLSRMGLFRGCSRMREGGSKRLPTLKSVTYFPTMVILGTVIIYLKKIKIYINHVTPALGFADISIFSSEISNCVISRNTDMDSILIDNF